MPLVSRVLTVNTRECLCVVALICFVHFSPTSSIVKWITAVVSAAGIWHQSQRTFHPGHLHSFALPLLHLEALKWKAIWQLADSAGWVQCWGWCVRFGMTDSMKWRNLCLNKGTHCASVFNSRIFQSVIQFYDAR